MSNFIVGLTGGVGSGKSIVARAFEHLGATIIDSDQIARELIEPGTPVLEKISQHFGNDILCANGSLNRLKLRQIVFIRPASREWLEALLHPLIVQVMIEKAKKSTSSYCIFVLPLLVEAKLEAMVDRILVVDTPKELQIERVEERDQMTRQEIENIMQAQVSREERLLQADDVIQNVSSLQVLKEKVSQLHTRYLKLAGED